MPSKNYNAQRILRRVTIRFPETARRAQDELQGAKRFEVSRDRLGWATLQEKERTKRVWEVVDCYIDESLRQWLDLITFLLENEPDSHECSSAYWKRKYLIQRGNEFIDKADMAKHRAQVRICYVKAVDYFSQAVKSFEKEYATKGGHCKVTKKWYLA